MVAVPSMKNYLNFFDRAAHLMMNNVSCSLVLKKRCPSAWTTFMMIKQKLQERIMIHMTKEHISRYVLGLL